MVITHSRLNFALSCYLGNTRTRATRKKHDARSDPSTKPKWRSSSQSAGETSCTIIYIYCFDSSACTCLLRCRSGHDQMFFFFHEEVSSYPREPENSLLRVSTCRHVASSKCNFPTMPLKEQTVTVVYAVIRQGALPAGAVRPVWADSRRPGGRHVFYL